MRTHEQPRAPKAGASVGRTPCARWIGRPRHRRHPTERSARPRSAMALARAALLALILASALGAGPAFAGEVECGSVLTEDTVLERALTDCPGDGLVIGADDITLDINGHSIT